jgi:hypothetical protein
MTYEGGCHCGNVRYALETTLAIDALPLRACQCSFCRRHGALSTSDPAGRVSFSLRDSTRVTRYRFGLKTADFLLCADCGVYVAAVIGERGEEWAVMNANTLDGAARLRQPITPMTYEGESASQRNARRRERWTRVGGSSVG